MTINNKDYYCYECCSDFNESKTESKKVCTSCEKIFHDKCWMGSCPSYHCQKKLKDKQFSTENWSTVATTTAILALGIITQWALKK